MQKSNSGAKPHKLRFDILTIFPEAFTSYLGESLMARARKAKLLDVRLHDIRAFSKDRHNKVDDRPFGGGPGMVLKIEPIHRAVQFLRLKIKDKNEKCRIILFSMRGKKLDANVARRLAKYDRLVFICGRYEGVDERVAEHIADEEISIGDFVLSGGELPALVTMEAVSRYLPGFLGKYESLEDSRGSFPSYTRPEAFYPMENGKRKKENVAKLKAGNKRQGVNKEKIKKAWVIPKVLVSGDHEKIEAWRRGHSS